MKGETLGLVILISLDIQDISVEQPLTLLQEHLLSREMNFMIMVFYVNPIAISLLLFTHYEDYRQINLKIL